MNMVLQEKAAKLSTFPAFVKVAGKVVVIVGNGEEALAKARLVAQTEAVIRILADEPGAALMEFAAGHAIEVRASAAADDMADATLIFAASGNAGTDALVSSTARRLGIPVNVVDSPQDCDFFTPAIVNRAPVMVAIGTEGAGPVLSQMIRSKIDTSLPPELGRTAELAKSYRHAVESLVEKGVSRRRYWRAFFEGEPARQIAKGDVSSARRAATKLLRSREKVVGHVSLVGAGPGAEDLLTLRAHRLLMEADAIVYDALVPESLVAMGRRDAERFPVGKRKGCHSRSQNEINHLLVSLGLEGKRVVRLKSGDPLVFGRAGEELAALRNASISHEIVPGVTSALAAAADFSLPLTLRGTASSLVFTTGHDLKGEVLPDWARLAVGGATVAVYMGRTVAVEVAARLMAIGLPSDTPVAAVENAGRPHARLQYGTLEGLPSLASDSSLKGPVMVIIGEAVAGADLARATPFSTVLTMPKLEPAA